jgi:uncharacterized protein (DUF1786 family)
MQILAVDIGTGTQDILLIDPRYDVENAFKLVLPSPTMIVRRHIQRATRQRQAILLQGVLMGGGPCAWAAEDHLKAGFTVYATPQAALTFNDDLQAVADLGVRLVSEDEAARLPASIERIELRDFDLNAIRRALSAFGLDLDADLGAVVAAVFDHGAAPVGVSDRQFRFDYLDQRIRLVNRLSAFAYPRAQIPPILTRLQAVAQSAADLDAPLVLMDTAPAAVLGACFDPFVADLERALIVNIGNFHTIAFRLGKADAAGQRPIEGVFEHHTGLLDRPKLEALLRSLAAGTLTHAEVFGANGHGALVYDPAPFTLGPGGLPLIVTGPRRSMLAGSALAPYFAAPYGDMMIAGCFGLLSAAADVLPELREPILSALGASSSRPPWE